MKNNILDILIQCENRLLLEIEYLNKLIKRNQSPIPIPIFALTMSEKSILQLKLSAKEGVKLRRKLTRLIKELSNRKCSKGCSCRVPAKHKSKDVDK